MARPAREAAAELVHKHASTHPVWRHRKIRTVVCPHGHVGSEATVLRLLRDEGLILPAEYERDRRKLAERRKAAFAADSTAPIQVWQLEFSEFETPTRGTWRLTGCRYYGSKYEHRFNVSLTAKQHDAIDAVKLALANYEQLWGRSIVDDCPVDPDTGALLPVVTLVTDVGQFRAFRFEAFIKLHPGLVHAPARVRTPRAERVTRTRIRHVKYDGSSPHVRDRRRGHARERAEDYRT